MNRSRPQAPREESMEDRRKLTHAIRRCNTNLALSQNMKVLDALQLALQILNDTNQDPCLQELDQVLDE
jgi:hypothetical protein